MMQRPRLRALGVCATIATALGLASAPAQAVWAGPGTTDSGWDCGGFSMLTGLKFQECANRHLTLNYVQSVIMVTNIGTTARTVTATTEMFSGPARGRTLVHTACPATAIAVGARRWCYGQTMPLARNVPIYAIGELFQGSEYSFAYSPTPFTAPIPPPQPKPPAPAPSPAAPPGPCTDCDGDGYQSMVESSVIDCVDTDPAIHPGSVDVPGNGIDEDCSTTDAPIPELHTSIVPRFLRYPDNPNRRYTIVTRLVVRPAPGGSTIRVRCSGGGCPFKTKTRAVKRDHATLNLLPLLRRARLRPRARLEVRVTKPGTIGRSSMFTMRADKFPRETNRCLPAGARPRKCSQ